MPKGVYIRKKAKGLEEVKRPSHKFKHWEEMCHELETGAPCLWMPGKQACKPCLTLVPWGLEKRARERAVEDKEQAKSEALVRAMERSMVLRRTYAADGEIPPGGAVVISDAKS